MCRYLVRWWCLVARIKVLQQYPKGNSKYFLWEIISSRSIRCSFYVSYLNTMSPLHPGDEQFTELNFLEVACLKTSQICAHCFMEIGNCWKLDVKTLKCLKRQRIQRKGCPMNMWSVDCERIQFRERICVGHCILKHILIENNVVWVWSPHCGPIVAHS